MSEYPSISLTTTKSIPIEGTIRTYWELQKRGYYLGRERITKVKKELNLRTLYPEPKTTIRKRPMHN